jgi:NifU-like protein involved in Fe-S cluster formation
MVKNTGSCIVRQGPNHGPSPLPQEGRWIEVKKIDDISGLTHGCGTCAPHMGACKLTLNVKKGVIREALIENIGCSGMTHAAAMAAEILPHKTLIEALNTDLVCDAINKAMRELFLQISYGRTQSSFSDGGLPIGAAWEDLGAGARSQVGTSYGTTKWGVRYLDTTEGYITRMGLDGDDEVIGYEFVNVGKMMSSIASGMSADEALLASKGVYGRFNEAVRYIDPRHSGANADQIVENGVNCND